MILMIPISLITLPLKLITYAHNYIYRSRFKIVLTGTPVQNNMGEMFCLLHYLVPKIFDENVVFDGCFSLDGSNIVVDRKALTNAHYMLRTFVLRRLKSEVEFSLPSKLETLVRCPLSAMQTFWTKSLLSKDSDLISRIASDDKGGRHSIPLEVEWHYYIM